MRTIIISLAYLCIVLSLLVSGLNAEEQKRKPPKEHGINLSSPKEDIEDIKQELGPDWENSILEHVKSEYPAELENLQKIKEKNPEKYQRKLIKFWQEIRRELRLKNDDPQLYKQVRRMHELDHRCDSLAEEYRKTKDKSRHSEIRVELKTKLGELFVIREAEREAKISELEQEIKQLKEMAAQRQQKKDEIIQKRLDEMLGEGDKLEW
jgi:hypothetical protein